MKEFAATLGLDTGTFNDCLDSGKYTDIVAQDTSIAQAIGVRSTPTFVVNGQPIVGAQPYETFAQTFDSLLIK